MLALFVQVCIYTVMFTMLNIILKFHIKLASGTYMTPDDEVKKQLLNIKYPTYKKVLVYLFMHSALLALQPIFLKNLNVSVITMLVMVGLAVVMDKYYLQQLEYRPILKTRNKKLQVISQQIIQDNNFNKSIEIVDKVKQGIDYTYRGYVYEDLDDYYRNLDYDTLKEMKFSINFICFIQSLPKIYKHKDVLDTKDLDYLEALFKKYEPFFYDLSQLNTIQEFSEYLNHSNNADIVLDVFAKYIKEFREVYAVKVKDIEYSCQFEFVGRQADLIIQERDLVRQQEEVEKKIKSKIAKLSEDTKIFHKVLK